MKIRLTPWVSLKCMMGRASTSAALQGKMETVSPTVGPKNKGAEEVFSSRKFKTWIAWN